MTRDGREPAEEPTPLLPPSSLPAETDPLPSHLGPYRVLGRLGVGGMGEVYRAYDETLAREVAVKVVRAELLSPSHALGSARGRFRHEARAAARLNHPNIVQVFHILEIEGADAIVMERVEGRSLSAILRDGLPELVEALGWARQVALGLAEAHDKGIVHRDLKPANVMVTEDGRVKVLDFGLAKIRPEEDPDEEVLTGIGQVVGSYESMSPEQARGHGVGPRSDLFALGVLLFEMITGDKPFRADSPVETLNRICARPHPSVRASAPSVPAKVEALIDRLLAKLPANRPPSAAAVAAELAVLEEEAAGSGVGPGARPELPETESRPEESRRRASTEPVPLDAATPVLGAVVAYGPTEAQDRTAEALVKSLGGRASIPGIDVGRAALPDGFHLAFFDHPSPAVQLAVAWQESLQGSGTPEDAAPGVAVHFGELSGDGPDAVEVALDLAALALPRQILLGRHAFDLARGALDGPGEPGAGSRSLTWLAHGRRSVAGEASVEIFEVGWQGWSPLRPPKPAKLPSSEGAEEDPEAVLGWRPAAGLEVPGRPRWRLEARLGTGPAGEAWLVRHRRTGERRVLKFCFDARRLRALQREITLFRLLKEDLGTRTDIARVLDWSFDEPPFYIESEYTEGGDLAAWVAARGGAAAVPLPTRLAVVAQVADALGAAHSVGVLHKSVEPGNILLSSDGAGRPRAKLADFGVGSLVDRRRLEASSITYVPWRTEEEPDGGRSLYRAPEIWKGERATVQGDVYSLGVVLYQLVVGDLDRALAPGWERDVQDPLLRSDIAAAVDGRPELRLQSAGALAERLRGLEERRARSERERAAAAESAALERRAKRVAKRRRRASVVVTVLALLGGLATLQTVRLADQRARADREAATARAVSDFLVQLFRSSDPLAVDARAVDGTVDVPGMLDQGAERARQELADRPGLQARLLAELGTVYASLGRRDAARQELLAALELSSLAPDATTEALAHWGLANLALGSGAVEEAEASARRALALHRRGDLGGRAASRGAEILRRLGWAEKARGLEAGKGASR